MQDACAAVRKVLERFRKANFDVKAKKCKWAQEEFEFLGHRVGKHGLQCFSGKVQAVRDWPAPRNVSEVHSFLGLATYFRRCVQGLQQDGASSDQPDAQRCAVYLGLGLSAGAG